MTQTLQRTSCPECKKVGKDNNNINLVVYKEDNGKVKQKCMRSQCNNHISRYWNPHKGDPDVPELMPYPKEFTLTNTEQILESGYKDLIDRGISKKTCEILDIKFLKIKRGNEIVEAHDYIYTNLDGTKDIQRRYLPKQFKWIVSNHHTDLFALDKCNDFNKPLCITEGVLDAASLWEVGYQACALVSASTVDKQIKQGLEKINKFPEIWICSDNDGGDGEVARDKLIKLLSHKVIKIVDFSPRKDANDYLRTDTAYASDRDELVAKLQNSKEIIPSGIISGNNLDFDKLKNQVIKSIPIPWPQLNKGLNGFEYGCLYLFLAGTGCGKSTVLRELAYWYRKNLPELKIANFFLEENEKVTPLAYMALDLNIPLGQLRREITNIDQATFDKAKQIIDTDHLIFVEKDFHKTSDNILNTIEYLVTVQKVDLIIIDHISYIIGRTGVSKHGERRDIDEFLYKLQDLTQRLECIILAVSHVNESDSKKRWDQGEVPNIYSGRGSKALAQIPDGIIGLARDHKSDALELYNLKNRWFAKLGMMDILDYIDDTGRLKLR